MSSNPRRLWKPTPIATSRATRRTCWPTRAGDITLSRATSDYGYLLMPQSCRSTCCLTNATASQHIRLRPAAVRRSSMTALKRASATRRPANTPWRRWRKRPSPRRRGSHRQCGRAGQHLYVRGRHHQFQYVWRWALSDGSRQVRHRYGGQTTAVETRQVQTSIADISMSLLQVMALWPWHLYHFDSVDRRRDRRSSVL